MLCYVILCYAMLWQVSLFDVVLCDVMSWYVMLCNVMLICYVMSCYIYDIYWQGVCIEKKLCPSLGLDHTDRGHRPRLVHSKQRTQFSLYGPTKAGK